MENYEVINTVVQLIITGAVAALGFFLKRQANRQDGFAEKEDVTRLEKEVAENKQDIKQLNDKYATKEELREIKSDISEMRKAIDFVKDNAVDKKDFIMNISEIKSDIKDLKAFLMNK